MEMSEVTIEQRVARLERLLYLLIGLQAPGLMDYLGLLG
jgi:hypothetical protein